MSKDDYEYDYDDDGNEIRTRITREMLKARLAAAEKRVATASRSASKALHELQAMKRRQDNAYWCDKLKTVLDDGTLIATDLELKTEVDYIDVTGRLDAWTAQIPGQARATLVVTYTGDDALVRYARFLNESR